MFTTAAAGAANTGDPAGPGVKPGRRRSRVRGLPETLGELPVACLAEEIDTPGEGQVRALVTVAGNPVLSTPNASASTRRWPPSTSTWPSTPTSTRPPARRRDPAGAHRAAEGPLRPGAAPAGPAQRGQLQPAGPPMDEGQMDEWHILARLALISRAWAPAPTGAGRRPGGRRGGQRRWATRPARSPAGTRTRSRPLLGGRTGPERLIDLMLRTGPYGDGFGPTPAACRSTSCWRSPTASTWGRWSPGCRRAAHPDRHGGAGARSCWRTSTGCGPRSAPPPGADAGGPADLRSNNSWMHNVEVLVKGKPRCTVHVHPDDAARLGLADGADAEVSSRTGKVTIPVEVTDAIRPGWSASSTAGATTSTASSCRSPAATRGEQQPAGRRRADRPGVGHVGPQRHPGRAQPRVTATSTTRPPSRTTTRSARSSTWGGGSPAARSRSRRPPPVPTPGPRSRRRALDRSSTTSRSGRRTSPGRAGPLDLAAGQAQAPGADDRGRAVGHAAQVLVQAGHAERPQVVGRPAQQDGVGQRLAEQPRHLGR